MTTIIERASNALTTDDKTLGDYARQCHVASLELVRTGEFADEGARVARGVTPGIIGQHSWVALGDPYDPDVVVIDPTLWSYVQSVQGVWSGFTDERPHRPHGAGSIWDAGPPVAGDGDPIELTPRDPLSSSAEAFLEMVGPLDIMGWAQLANLPVGGWPSAEVIAAMDDTPELAAFIPVDRLGMLTDRNPSRLYMVGPDKTNRAMQEAQDHA